MERTFRKLLLLSAKLLRGRAISVIKIAITTCIIALSILPSLLVIRQHTSAYATLYNPHMENTHRIASYVHKPGGNTINVMINIDRETNELELTLTRHTGDLFCINDLTNLGATRTSLIEVVQLEIYVTRQQGYDCNEESGDSVVRAFSTPIRIRHYFYPFDYSETSLHFNVYEIPKGCREYSCFISPQDTGLVFLLDGQVGYLHKITSTVPEGDLLAGEGRVSVFSQRNDYHQKLIPLLVFFAIGLIALSILIKDLGTFIQSLLAIIFGLLGMKQIVAPFQTKEPIVLDEVLLSIYITAALAVVARFLILLVFSLKTPMSRVSDDMILEDLLGIN